jgi:GNAT superfamily N-acetyltransferase
MDEFNNVIVKKMTRNEFSQAIEWAAAEGWNPGMHDADCFYAADPHGFFLAELNGEMAGCLSAVAYDDFFGFAGFYIVRRELRGHGIGHQLISRASAYMGNRTIGNDAVVAQQESYKKYGFRMAYRNIRYRGFASSDRVNIPEMLDLHKIPFSRLTDYDRGMFPARRSTFLNRWINQPEERPWVT